MQNHDVQEWIKNIGRRAAEIRGRKGLTQAQVAVKLEISQRSYQVWEIGKKEMKIGTLYKLSRALGVKPSELLKKAKSLPPGPGRPKRNPSLKQS